MIPESLRQRGSVYALNKDLPLSKEQIGYLVEDIVELVPDAFDMKSSRVVLCFNDKHEALWDLVDKAYDFKIDPEKIAGYKAAAGTILFFVDEVTVDSYKEQFAIYKNFFDTWADQASGMLQISIWTGLAEEGIGANIQHYNPVIDSKVHELFDLPPSYRLVAEMPFGGIAKHPADKDREDVARRVTIID